MKVLSGRRRSSPVTGFLLSCFCAGLAPLAAGFFRLFSFIATISVFSPFTETAAENKHPFMRDKKGRALTDG